jgi:hypothetical protein
MKDLHKKLKNFIPIDSSFKNYGDNFLSIGYDKNKINSKLELRFDDRKIDDKNIELIVDLLTDGTTLFRHYSVFNTDIYTLDEAKDKISYYFICEMIQYGVKCALEQRDMSIK